MRRMIISLAIAWSLFAATETRADTIVLKNGRRINAQSVVVEGEKVRYVTSAGELALPKSMVDHIEKGGLAQMPGASSEGAASLAIAPPNTEAMGVDAAVESGAVHDGGVDREFLAAAASEARSGSALANKKAAFAHHAAAQFEVSHGDMEHALSDERTALTYAPETPLLLTSAAHLHLPLRESKMSL